ncbi:MAG: Fic family protein [Thermomicrobiales bacterium]
MDAQFRCDLHEILLQNTRDAGTRPGTLREIQNWIGPSDSIQDATYVAPPPSAMRSRLMTLESNINSYVAIPPLIRLAQSHYQFEALHPFIDGNGRLGRLLLSLLLAKWNILPQPDCI